MSPPRLAPITEREKSILVDLVDGKKDILNSKRTDVGMIAKKTRAWRDIAELYAASGCTPRTHQQLKKSWSNPSRLSKAQ